MSVYVTPIQRGPKTKMPQDSSRQAKIYFLYSKTLLELCIINVGTLENKGKNR